MKQTGFPAKAAFQPKVRLPMQPEAYKIDVELQERQPEPPPKRDSNSGQYDLQEMRGRHHIIARLHVQGYKNIEIAEMLDVTPQMVSYTLNSTIVKDKIRLLERSLDFEALDVMQEVRKTAKFAHMVQEQLMLDPNTDPKTRVKIAQDMLDRAGHAAPQRIEHAHAHMTKQDLEELKQRARRKGKTFSESNGEDDG